MLILIIILILVLGGGGGYYGHSRWGYGGGAGIGLGTILLILLIAYLLGGLRWAKIIPSLRTEEHVTRTISEQWKLEGFPKWMTRRKINVRTLVAVLSRERQPIL
jgi:hypothetical protein